MASQWYYNVDGQQLGPVSADELRALVDAGKVRSTDTVWKEGLADWIPASQVNGLFRAPTPSVPPARIAPPPPRRAIPTPSPDDLSVGVATGEVGLPFSAKQKTRRVLLLVGGAVSFLMFFTPQFYVSAGEGKFSTSSVSMGWHAWFGFVTFGLGIVALSAAIVDLAMQKTAVVRGIMQWVHLGLHVATLLAGLLGTTLGAFGIGMSVWAAERGERGTRVAIGDIPEGVAVMCIPITIVLVVVASLIAVLMSVAIVRGDRK